MKKILIIDDKASERERAVEACRSMGIECVVCDPGSDDWRWFENVPLVDAIVTDLFWSHNMTHPAMRGKEPPPSGLLVVIHGLTVGKPVVVCTDAAQKDQSWGHHGAAIGWIHGGYVKHMNTEGPPSDNPPAFDKPGETPLGFGWQPDKNWGAAIDKALARLG